MIWTPNDDELDLCIEFAVAYVNKERANRSDGRFAGDQRYIQAVKGKLAELAWQSVTGGTVNFDITPVGRFDSDITGSTVVPFAGKKLHVKTTKKDGTVAPYDSWMVERKDPLITDPQPEDILLLSYTYDNFTVELFGILPVSALKEAHWQPTEVIPQKLCIKREHIERYLVRI